MLNKNIFFDLSDQIKKQDKENYKFFENIGETTKRFEELKSIF